jgi:hypothetical protein
MGRPLNKRYFGATEGAVGTEGNNLTVMCKIGSNSAVGNGVILSQRSETKFNCHDDPDGSSGNTGVCTLVDKAIGALGANEMILQGFVTGGDDANAVNIRKVHNRTMIDFDNNRYTWTVQDDSSANVLVLTAI